jgi:hypothetical protein
MQRDWTQRALLVVLLALAAVPIAGCSTTDPAARAGIEMKPPAVWRPVSVTSWRVPGTALAAWSGPGGASLVLYRTLPVPGGSATSLANSLATRLENLTELKVLVKRTEPVSGVYASRVEVIAPGTGDSLASTGSGPPTAPPGKTLVPTRQVTVGFIRPDQTLQLTWHLPEALQEQIGPDIQATLGTIRFIGAGSASSYSD